MVRKDDECPNGMGRVNKFIREGDVVLVSGLYGDDVKIYNNKLGYVKHIVLLNNPVSLDYAAYVTLDLKTTVPINLLFLYNIKTLATFDEILLDSTFLGRYLKAKKSIHNGFNIDNTGNHNAIIFSKNGAKNIFTISTLN